MKNKFTCSYVMWSGGLDSTYLIQKLLEEDRDRMVIAGYTELINNVHKTKQELAAIQKMLPIFENKYKDRFEYVGVVYRAEVSHHARWAPLVQMPIWMASLMSSTPKEATEVCLGYVMNDCAISYLNEFKTMMKSFGKLISDSGFPKVMFPLAKINKEMIVKALDPQLKELVVWCEMPNVTGTGHEASYQPCGHCASCQYSPLLKLHSSAVKEEFVETFNKKEPQWVQHELFKDSEISSCKIKSISSTTVKEVDGIVNVVNSLKDELADLGVVVFAEKKDKILSSADIETLKSVKVDY